MAGNVVPGASGMMLRRFAHAAPAQIPHNRMPSTGHVQNAGARGSGGTGGSRGLNPMRPDDLQYDAQGNAILPPGGMGRPGTVSGIIGRMMDKADQSDYEKRLGQAHTDKTSKIQSALDAYDSALKDSDGNKALAVQKLFSGDGHQHFMDPDVFNAVAAYHSSVPGGAGEFSIKPLGSGYSVLNTPDGPQVVQDRNVAGKVVNIKGVGPATVKVDPSSGQATITPAKMAGGGELPEQYSVKPSPKSDEKLQAATTILRNLDDMRASGGAVGALGWGYLERLAATKTGIPAPVAATYNAAHNQMVPALLTLNRAVGAQTRGEGNKNLLQLPEPTQANALTMGQTLPRIEDLARQVISQLWTEAHAGHWSNFGEIDAMAHTYGASPAEMHAIADARHQLMADPAGMRPDQVKTLQHEMVNGRLPLNVQEETAAQMGWQGLIDAPTAAKMSEVYPGLAQKLNPADPEGMKRMPRDPGLRKGLNPGPNPAPTPIPQQQTVTPPVQPTSTAPSTPAAQAPAAGSEPPQPGQHPTGENPLNAPTQQPSAMQQGAAFLQREGKPAQSSAPATPEQLYGGAAPPAQAGTPQPPIDREQTIPPAQATQDIRPVQGEGATSPLPPNPMQRAADEAMTGPDKAETDRQAQAAALLRQAHDMLMRNGPTEAPAEDQ